MKPTDEQASAWTEAFDSGKFVRKSSEFRDSISNGGTFDVESGRYHLYISYACPWAHRTLMTRNLLGLEQHISVDVVDWRMNRDGSWSFNPEEEGATADNVNGESSLKASTTGLSKAGMKAVASVLFRFCGTRSMQRLSTMRVVKSSECSINFQRKVSVMEQLFAHQN